MSDSQSKSEVLDVLSSIRRLVSEGRRPVGKPEPETPEAVEYKQPEAEGSTLSPAGRLVLTPSLRVSEPAVSDDEPNAKATETDEGGDNTLVADLAETGTPSSHITGASLEDTIAELEAAVAEIETEFEPDGGDPDTPPVEPFSEEDWEDDPAPVEARAEDAISGRLAADGDGDKDGDDGDADARDQVTRRVAAAEPEFHGIMARFELTSAADERLDTPITAEAPQDGPPPPPGDIWHAGQAKVTAHVAAQRASQHSGKPSLFARARSGDLGQVPLSDFEAVQDDRADDREPAPVVDDMMGTGQGSPQEVVPEDVDDLPDPVVSETKPEVSAEIEDLDEAEEEAVASERHEANEGQVLTGEAPLTDLSANPTLGRLHLGTHAAGRPFIYRQEEPATEGEALTLDVGDEGDAAADDANDTDLFNPLNAADMDIALLRDMVAEVIREELRGNLGERITRNLRLLVRREIARVLEAEPPKDR